MFFNVFHGVLQNPSRRWDEMSIWYGYLGQTSRPQKTDSPPNGPGEELERVAVRTACANGRPCSVAFRGMYAFRGRTRRTRVEVCTLCEPKMNRDNRHQQTRFLGWHVRLKGLLMMYPPQNWHAWRKKPLVKENNLQMDANGGCSVSRDAFSTLDNIDISKHVSPGSALWITVVPLAGS